MPAGCTSRQTTRLQPHNQRQKRWCTCQHFLFVRRPCAIDSIDCLKSSCQQLLLLTVCNGGLQHPLSRVRLPSGKASSSAGTGRGGARPSMSLQRAVGCPTHHGQWMYKEARPPPTLGQAGTHFRRSLRKFPRLRSKLSETEDCFVAAHCSGLAGHRHHRCGRCAAGGCGCGWHIIQLLMPARARLPVDLPLHLHLCRLWREPGGLVAHQHHPVLHLQLVRPRQDFGCPGACCILPTACLFAAQCCPLIC